ncbi:MAG: hypothetical protein FJ405_12585, partial [Verrucomicrobia bacterium]|nr:hypothetical protein [Verrucomicrobiota bacterium]
DRNSRLLRSGLDFTYIWTRLALRQGISGDSLVLVRPLFLEGAAANNRVTGDAIASFGGGSTEKAVQEVLRQRKAFAGRLTGLLEPEARREFDRWWAETGENYNLPGTPPAAQPPLRRLWDLERGFAGMTLTSDASSQQINEWRAWILESTKARDELVGRENASPLEDPATMERLQDKLEPLRRALSERITAGAGAAKHADYEGGMAPRFRPTQAPDEREPVQGTSAMVYVPPGDGAAQVFDYVTLTSRAAGYKVHLHKDRMLHSMSTLNLIFEYNERFVVAEPMAFEFYRRAGVPAPQTEFARLYVDGEPLGYHLLVEQPNKSFLRRNRIQEDGHLYKLLWYGKGLVGQHEKKTRERSGHTDLQALATELQATTDPKELGQLIERHFNVGSVASYFAVNACLSHWDGFFNNYFAYHDTEGTRRWTLFPWDQDKAWGFHDGLGPDEVFFDMPLSYGMAGDQRPAASGLAGLAGLFGFGGRGFHVWWRPGGWFSKPLLANPMFRQIYLRRIKQLLQEEYVLSKWEPVFVEMERKLTPEVKFRAEILNESPEQAVTRLRRDIDLLRKHITRRRDFLLAESELQQIP